MPKQSAGILAYRFYNKIFQILLVHPGGPFYAKKDSGAWSVPKGEYQDIENPWEVAKREFNEETGNTIFTDVSIPLSPVKLKSGKIVSVWGVHADFDTCFISSNTFELEWPPKSGKKQLFPEVDKAEWFTIEEAKSKINPVQFPLIEDLYQKLITQTT